MKSKTIGYWVTTAIVAFVLISGGAAQVAQRPENIEGFARLGYPLYFMVLLGVWKFLGGVALLVPRFPRLKEWAYAGAFFDLTGGAVSEAAGGGSVAHIVFPAIFALITLVSWALRPESRIVGDILPSKARA